MNSEYSVNTIVEGIYISTGKWIKIVNVFSQNHYDVLGIYFPELPNRIIGSEQTKFSTGTNIQC